MRYLLYDVFTSEPLLGNQLAVFPDANGLDSGAMQAIAREMNLSETSFILPPQASGTDVRMRIFTPRNEMPMAGHPTIGSTFALAHLGTLHPDRSRFVFGLNVGPVPVDLEWSASALRFAWMTQPKPMFGPTVDAREAVASALGLGLNALAERLPVQPASCGVPFLFVPLRDRAIVDQAVSDAGAIGRLNVLLGSELPVFLFAIDESGGGVYSRMFAPVFGISEDPATGAASGPLGCYLVEHGVVAGEEAQRIVNLQGVAMGRASRIHVAIEGRRGAIDRVRIGGEAVLVGRGELLVR